MKRMETENAQIDETFIGFEDHGAFVVNIAFKGPGWGQGTGCYCLGPFQSLTLFIKGVLKATGAESWEELPGKMVRVRREGIMISEVGHIMEDRWFDIRNWRDQSCKAEGRP